ncbi:MAG TPA: hypothetical protein VN682_18285 [Terriglobales bacterium]|jgi:hypothetical protein|nr:hypothetical protein [Terriglobales bacterium]
MNVASARRFLSASFYVGPIVAALLLSAGIIAIVDAVREPLAAAVITGINYVLHHRFPDTLRIQEAHVFWPVDATYAAFGALLLGAGFCVAFWIAGQSDPSTKS